MLVQFNTLPEEARVWIYQANRSFTEEELDQIKHKLEQFITQWTAHGSDLKAGFDIRYKRFIVYIPKLFKWGDDFGEFLIHLNK